VEENAKSEFVEENYGIRSMVSIIVEDALEDSGRILEEFSQAQRRVIYSAAEAGFHLKCFMNPKFSAFHMQFILEQLQLGKDVSWLPVGAFHENIVRKPLTRIEIADIRKRIETANTKKSLIADLKHKSVNKEEKAIKERKIFKEGVR
jgi:hypothetical protein